MRRRIVQFLLAMLALAVLVTMLRQDLSNLALRRGTEALRGGDVSGALAAYRQAVGLGRDGTPLSYNLGVTYYLKGEYALAQRQFDAVIAKAGPKLMPAALYNRGNTQFRQAERLVARDRQAAMSLFQAAIKDYRKALDLTPDAGDARSNLGLAQGRLVALVSAGQGKQGRQADPEQGRASEKSGKSGSKVGAPARSEQKTPGENPAANSDLSSSGKSRISLNRAEVDRLLNDARGRDKPLGVLHGDQAPGQLARPDRDW